MSGTIEQAFVKQFEAEVAGLVASGELRVALGDLRLQLFLAGFNLGGEGLQVGPAGDFAGEPRQLDERVVEGVAAGDELGRALHDVGRLPLHGLAGVLAADGSQLVVSGWSREEAPGGSTGHQRQRRESNNRQSHPAPAVAALYVAPDHVHPLRSAKSPFDLVSYSSRLPGAP